MENNYPSNSHAYKNAQKTTSVTPVEEKKVEKVISGTARIRKKNGFRKMLDNFISEDVPDMKTYLVKDVLVPTTKRIISELVDTVLFGKSQRSNRGNTIGTRVSYNRFYDEPRKQDSSQAKPVYTFDEVVVGNRGEAERVLSQMQDIIDTYEMVSVGDMYDLVGITGDPYTNQRYGWVNISNAEIVRLRDGDYLIQMPKAIPIKR